MSESSGASGDAVDVVLSDGGTVHVRPIRADDADRLVALHGRLSPTSVYYRFFSVKPRLTDAEVHRFVNVDGRDRVALVAVLGDEIVAVGRYDRWGGHDEAEVAFTVVDAHQGRGLGAVLLEHLAAVGRVNGLRSFTAQVLPENRAMLSVFRRAGFEVRRSFEGGVVDLEFPIEVTPAVLATLERREQRADSASIARFLHARSIAVFGASDRHDSVGGRIVRSLLAHGFTGDIHPVNPRRNAVLGLPAVVDLTAIVGDVDLAVVAVPSDQVPGVLDACAARGVRGSLVVTVLDDRSPGPTVRPTAGELARAARGQGMRLVGPGSFGIVERTGGSTMYASLGSVDVAAGAVAISVQSGPLAAGVLELAHRVGLGVASFVSLGDAADVGAADLLNHWADDADVAVALLYVERYGDPRRFGRVARRFSLVKPLVAVRAGLAGGDAAAAEALEHRAGVVRVATVRQMVDVGRLLAQQPLPSGPGAAVVTNTVSPALLVSDTLRGIGAAVVAPAPGAAAAAGGRVRADGVIDLGPAAGADDYTRAVTAVLGDPTVPAVIVIYAPPLDPDPAVFAAIEDASHDAGRPVVAVALGRGDAPLVAGGRIPAFAFPEPAAYVLGAAWQYARWRAANVTTEPGSSGSASTGSAITGSGMVAPGSVDAMRTAIDVLLLGGHGPSLDGPADRDSPDAGGSRRHRLPALTPLLSAAGIAVASAVEVATADDAVAAAMLIGYPVALKITGVSRPGRSEAGGVALDLQDAAAVRGAFTRMETLRRADDGGGAPVDAMVQAMAPPGVEVQIVIDNHPAYGPTVSCGLGGLYADVIGDGRRWAAPLSTDEATALIAESLAGVALARLGIGTQALVPGVLAAGRLADEVWELDRLVLNPVLVSEAGAWVLDAVGSVTARPDPEAGIARHV